MIARKQLGDANSKNFSQTVTCCKSRLRIAIFPFGYRLISHTNESAQLKLGEATSRSQRTDIISKTIVLHFYPHFLSVKSLTQRKYNFNPLDIE